MKYQSLSIPARMDYEFLFIIKISKSCLNIFNSLFLFNS